MNRGLTEKQIAKLRSELRERASALRQTIRDELIKSDNERYVDLANQVHDIGDESVADLLSDVNLAVIDLHITTLRELEEALERLRRGSYNLCEQCDSEIGYERLVAVPAARRCERCQAVYERTHAGQQHSML